MIVKYTTDNIDEGNPAKRKIWGGVRAPLRPLPCICDWWNLKSTSVEKTRRQGAPEGSAASRDEMTMLMGVDPRMRANQRRVPNPDCGFGEEDLGCRHGSKLQRKKRGADPGMGKVGNGRHFQMVGRM